MNLPITVLDAAVILLILASAGYAAWKGFLSETLTIFDWAAAAFGCLYFGPYLIPMMRGLVTTPWVAGLLAYAVVFLIIFIPLSFLSHRFSETVKHSPIGPLDRALGIAFGVVRGLVAVGLAYLAYTYFVPVPEQPRWIKEANTLPMIQSTADVLVSLVPSRTRGNFRLERDDSGDDAIGNLIRDNGAANRAGTDTSRGNSGGSYGERAAPRGNDNSPQGRPANNAQRGYGATDRRALDTLLQDGGGNRR
ncbi:MAG TPA: CvpA family protein [Rhizomicrobium sp.]|nr:CvpA family protein [Rhizomicrobium sp.]